MDFEKAFTYIKDDERWMTKLGIGAAVQFLIFLIFPIFLLPGYMLQIMRNVRDGVEPSLPEWADWGTLLMDGFTIIGAQLVYTLPFWLLTCLAMILTGGAGALADGVGGSGASDAAAIGILSVWGIVGCLSILLVVVWIFLAPAIAIQYVREETFASCFRFGEVIAIMRDNLSDILMITLAFIAAQFVITFVVGLLNVIPCIGTIIGIAISIALYPYLMMARGHLYGQLMVKMDGGTKDVMFE